MTEDILRMKLRVDISNWHIESVCRLIVVRFILFMLHIPRNLAGTKIKIEQGYRGKVGEISRLIPYLKYCRHQRNAAYLCKDKLVIWNFYKKVTRYRTPTKLLITL
jgi:hypothetical protein